MHDAPFLSNLSPKLIFGVCLTLLGLTLLGATQQMAVAIPPIESLAPLEDGGPAGFRFMNLDQSQVTALRRTVKLPLEALFDIESKRDLVARVEVSPLPDPGQPFLPVDTTNLAESKDPFRDQDSAYDLDPLAKLFAAENGASQSQTSDSVESPFASSHSESSFTPEPVAEEPAESDEQLDFDDDPFADI